MDRINFLHICASYLVLGCFAKQHVDLQKNNQQIHGVVSLEIISRHLKKETPARQTVKDHRQNHRNIATRIVPGFSMTGTQRESRRGFDGCVREALAIRGPNKIIKMLNFETSFLTCCGHLWSIFIHILYSLLYVCWMVVHVAIEGNTLVWWTALPNRQPIRGVKEVTNEVDRQANKNIIRSSFIPGRMWLLVLIGKLRKFDVLKGIGQNANFRMKLLRLKSRDL